AGYVGKVLTCHVSCIREGPLSRPSNRTWFRDVTLGANPLTIHAGHVLDTLRFVLGEIARLGSIVTSQVREWREAETGNMLAVTAPDNILVNCRLKDGTVASIHVTSVPWGPSGYRMAIY